MKTNNRIQCVQRWSVEFDGVLDDGTKHLQDDEGDSMSLIDLPAEIADAMRTLDIGTDVRLTITAEW